MRLAFALVLAVISAVGLNYGFFVQHEATAVGAKLSVRRPVHSARLLFTDVRWLVGFGAMFGGWLLYVWALALASLSLVQAASAGGIGVLALLVRRGQTEPLARREVLGVVFSIAGLALLGASLAGHREASGRFAPGAATIWMLALVVIAGLAAGPLARFVSPGAGLGIAAGTLYAAADVALKAAFEAPRGWIFLPLMGVFYGFGFVAIQLAFQRGGALVTAGMATTLNNSIPIAAGVALFGDTFPGGASGIARVAAFACVIAGAGMLARAEEPASHVRLAPTIESTSGDES